MHGASICSEFRRSAWHSSRNLLSFPLGKVSTTPESFGRGFLVVSRTAFNSKSGGPTGVPLKLTSVFASSSSIVRDGLSFSLSFTIAVNSSVLTDRKSTRLNSSHSQISYAVFCLKKKNYDKNS